MKAWHWFLAFTALFAVLATWIFWGTWSTSVVPVMPDCAWNHPSAFGACVWETFCSWWENGLFVPDDLKGYLISPWVTQEFQYVFAAYMAALAVAYFAFGHGLNAFAAFASGLLLAFSGYWFSLYSAGHLGWFRFMTYGLFTFGLIDRAVCYQRVYHWLLLGAVVAWGSFYQQDLWFLFTLLAGVYFIFVLVTKRTFPWKGMLLAMAALTIIGAPGFLAGLSAKASRETQISSEAKAEKGGETKAEDKAKRDEERWIFVTNWSLPIEETPELIWPRINGDTSCILTQSLGAKLGTGVKPYNGALGRPLGAKVGNYRQHSLYIGLFTVVMALFAVLTLFSSRADDRQHRRTIAFFAVASILTYLLALGRNFEPLYRLVFALPIGDSIRAPVKWLHLTEFTLAILAGFGIEAILRRYSKRPVLYVMIALVTLAAIDLARINRLYLAPVDMAHAQKLNASMEMTFLRQQDFSNPQIAAMHRQGLIQSLAYYPGRNDIYLVGVLKPREVKSMPLKPFSVKTALGMVSLFGTLGVLLAAVLGLRRRS